MALDDEIAQLTEIPFFEGFQREQLRLLAFGAEKRSLRSGDVLYRENDVADCAYLVQSGRVLVLSPGMPLKLTRETRIHERHDVGALIQPLALISNTKRPSGAMCDERTQLLRISRVLFQRMLREYPELAILLRRRIESELVDFVGKLDSVLEKLDVD